MRFKNAISPLLASGAMCMVTQNSAHGQEVSCSGGEIASRDRVAVAPHVAAANSTVQRVIVIGFVGGFAPTRR